MAAKVMVIALADHSIWHGVCLSIICKSKNITSHLNYSFMRILLLLVCFIALKAETCQKKKKPTETTTESNTNESGDITSIPKCIQSKIDSIKKEPRYNPPAEVTEYSYNDKRFFLFSSDCCDQYNSLFDENCNYVCAPSGGFTGKGDMKCNDFTEKAKLVKQVWKDDRK
jgi:hypothetical protein